MEYIYFIPITGSTYLQITITEYEGYYEIATEVVNLPDVVM